MIYHLDKGWILSKGESPNKWEKGNILEKIFKKKMGKGIFIFIKMYAWHAWGCYMYVIHV